MNIFKWLFNPDWFTFNMGGGGGPNTTYSNTSNIPEYARPYVEQMLGATQKQLFTGTNDAKGNFTPTGFNNFTPYGSTYQRDPNTGEAQRDSRGNVLYTNTAQQQAQAAVAPVSAGQQMATNTINQYVAPSQTQGASSIVGNLAGRSAASGYYSPLQAERFQLGSPQQVRTDSFTAPGVSQAYMSPYMQNVVNSQQREASRQSQIQRNQNQAQAVQQGAFGGSRQGIVEAERQRNLATQLGDIQGQGLQSAYQQGQGQFNAEQNAYLQAQQANQGANLNVATQNLQAQQQAQAAQEASRQFGANLGLQGYGQSLQAAQTLAQLGQQQYQQDMGTMQAMASMGAQEQAQQQAIINQEMQNYGTAQQYPLMQLGVMSNMLRGLPMQSSSTNMYQAQPSMVSQMAGAAGTGLGLVQQYNKAFPTGKEGGVVKMASGGITSGANRFELDAMYKKFSDGQLGKALDDPEAQREKQRRDALRGSMATGGVVAFKKGKKVKEDTEQKAEDITLPEADVGGEGILRAVGVPEASKEAEPSSAERIKSVSKSYQGSQPQPKAEALSQRLPDPGYMADNTPAAARSKPSAGISAAPNKMLSNVDQLYSDVEAANLEAGRDMQGNLFEKPKVNPLAEIEATTNEEMLRQKAIRDESKGDKIKRYEKERTDADIPDIFKVEKKKLEDRKLRGEKSEQETAQNNLIRFLTRWGTIPGSTMRGMIGAGAELVDKMDLDEKNKQKFLNELDDIDSRINSSEYARRVGDEGRAREEQQKAGEQYFKLGHDMRTAKVNYALKEMDAASKYEIAALKAEVAGSKAATKAPIIQAADKQFEGLIAEGKPANAVTYKQALKEVYAMQPSVQGAEIGLGPKLTSAGADLTRATTGITDAATRASEEGRKRLADYKAAVRRETMVGPIAEEIDRANAKDKTGKAAKAIEDRVKKDLAAEYGITPPAAAPAAAAPAKDDKKKGGGWGDLKVK
jgi:hypothetical protein